MDKHVTVGAHGSVGVEYVIDPHIAVQLDAGIEHFFSIDEVLYERTVFVPALAVIGRL